MIRRFINWLLRLFGVKVQYVRRYKMAHGKIKLAGVEAVTPATVDDFHQRLIAANQQLNQFYRQRPRPWRARGYT